jgi:hypothetical protein
LAVLAALVVLVGGAALYVRFEWWRMESACRLSDARGMTHGAVSYSWGWRPLGFRCTYGDGDTETSLWF